MEPVALRYFDIEPDGSLHYLTNDELDERATEFAAAKRGETPPKKITHYWYEQDSAFANVEIQFRPRGDANGAAAHVPPHRREPRRSAHGPPTTACSTTCAARARSR